MKRMFLIVLALTLCGGALAETAFVSISDGQGNIVMAHQPVELSDVDGDGAVTIYDCLYLAHEAAYEGGAKEGFAAEDQGYGLSITKLWGEENGGSYGYYVNNASAYSLTDPVSDSDVVRAYVYTDLEAWSDTYSYFEPETLTTESGSATLKLAYQYYDADWNSVVAPLEGAKIWIDGMETEFVSDANGQVEISGLSAGVHLVSARSDEMVLVPPVSIVTVSE